MIKKYTLCLLIAMMAGVSGFAFQGVSIGVVDADRVIQQSAKGKKFFEEYQAFGNAKRDQIETMVKDFQTKQSDFQAKLASMSEDKRKASGLELENMQTAIKRAQEDAQRESDQKLKTALDRFRKELGPLIREVAVEKSLDIIFNYGPNSNMVYFSEKVDITADVIKKYDAKSE